jgi:hypothetical protein
MEFGRTAWACLILPLGEHGVPAEILPGRYAARYLESERSGGATTLKSKSVRHAANGVASLADNFSMAIRGASELAPDRKERFVIGRDGGWVDRSKIRGFTDQITRGGTMRYGPFRLSKPVP